MEQKKYEIIYEEEKTLIDLIKLFVKNRFYILKVIQENDSHKSFKIIKN